MSLSNVLLFAAICSCRKGVIRTIPDLDSMLLDSIHWQDSKTLVTSAWRSTALPAVCFVNATFVINSIVPTASKWSSAPFVTVVLARNAFPIQLLALVAAL